jgi:uncharacterized membrane protein YkvA (DUF1232 family)
MYHSRQTSDVRLTAGFLRDSVRQVRLIWRLMTNRQVPTWTKLIPPLAILYVLSPIDLMPDPLLGVGQLDDLAVLLISFKVFVELCPPGLVQRIRDELIGSRPPDPEGDVVDASYRVLDDADDH